MNINDDKQALKVPEKYLTVYCKVQLFCHIKQVGCPYTSTLTAVMLFYHALKVGILNVKKCVNIKH